MQTVLKVTPGKNALWTVYVNAPTLVHDEVLLELKKADLYRHWQTVASKEGYDLINAKAGLRDIFLKIMPETAPYFGLPYKAVKKQKHAVPGTIPLFE